MKLFLPFVLIAFAGGFIGCTSEEPDEPEDPTNGSITIKSDGTTSTGAVFTAVDETTFLIDYVKYKVVNSHIEVVGCDKTELGANVKIYESVDYKGSKYVTRSINKNAFLNTEINTVDIPNTVQYIGDYAFRNCRNLTSVTHPGELKEIVEGLVFFTSVTLPDELKEIGESAFEGCVLFTSVTLPAGLKVIGESAFKGCVHLNYVRSKAKKSPIIMVYAFPYPYEYEIKGPTLYVPRDCRSSYEEWGWMNFFSEIWEVGE